MTPVQMQTVRDVLSDAVNATKGKERRIASMMLDRFDNFTAPLAPELAQARGIYSRAMRGEQLETLRELAEANRSRFGASGVENALRQEYRNLDRRIVKGQERGWSPAEAEAVDRLLNSSARTANDVDDSGCCDNELEKNLAGIGAHHIPSTVDDQFGDLEDDRDDEPSLGSLGSCGSGDQSRWGMQTASMLDAEDEHDGAEPDDDAEQDDADREPSLGWTTDGVFGSADGLDRELVDYSPAHDTKAARRRGRSKTPGVSVDRSRGYMTQIIGLTEQQTAKIGCGVVRT